MLEVSVCDMFSAQDHGRSQAAGGALGDWSGASAADELVGHRQELAGAGGAEGMPG